jgi:hypothetical protein
VTLNPLTLPIDVRHEAARLLGIIQNTKSMTLANRNGAVAEGFVLGIATHGLELIAELSDFNQE